DRHERAVRCGGRDGLRRRTPAIADGEVVWSWGPDAGGKFRGAIIREMTVAKEPGHRGEREGNRKTIAQGKPGCSRFTCGPTPCFFCTGPMGAIGTRLSLRPLHSKEGETLRK